jgi:hypothetical protein
MGNLDPPLRKTSGVRVCVSDTHLLRPTITEKCVNEMTRRDRNGLNFIEAQQCAARAMARRTNKGQQT